VRQNNFSIRSQISTHWQESKSQDSDCSQMCGDPRAGCRTRFRRGPVCRAIRIHTASAPAQPHAARNPRQAARLLPTCRPSRKPSSCARPRLLRTNAKLLMIWVARNCLGFADGEQVREEARSLARFLRHRLRGGGRVWILECARQTGPRRIACDNQPEIAARLRAVRSPWELCSLLPSGVKSGCDEKVFCRTGSDAAGRAAGRIHRHAQRTSPGI